MKILAEESAENLKQRLQQHLAEDLAAVNSILHKNLRSSNAFVSDVLEHVSRFRGKQIRPMLLLLSNGLLNRRPSPTAHTLAAVVELIHTATLVHDDVIDEAETRRHVATIHRRWNTETSVLLGDYLFSRSFHLAATTGDAEACRLIGLATDRTCEGELNQTAARVETSVVLDSGSDSDEASPRLFDALEREYFRIIRDKTGQLFALSCLLGARTADASPEQQRAARQFGMRLGMAFQIMDDLLDLQSSHSSTGKDSANDLINHRLTLPLIRALRCGTSQERQFLVEVVQRGKSSELHQLQEMNMFTDGLNSAYRTAEQLVQRAYVNLERFPESVERQLLKSIAAFSICRSH